MSSAFPEFADDIAVERQSVRLTGIVKSFGRVRALRGVDVVLCPHRVHGLLGENGAGKSTLVKVLYGLVTPDAGSVEVNGERQHFRSPADAIRQGIGLVQQHFSLIPDFSVWENVVLGTEPRRGPMLDRAAAASAVQALVDIYEFRLDASAFVRDLSVGAQQRVEIVKALYRGAEVLLLDEPTAVLAPREVSELFAIIDRLRTSGKTVAMITHKLPEVVAICDEVTALRAGEVVGRIDIDERERESPGQRAAVERRLARVLFDTTPEPTTRQPDRDVKRRCLVLSKATDGQALGEIDLTVHAGEIVGVAGVEGNGQSELVEMIVGVRRCATGQISIEGRSIERLPTGRRLRLGIAHIPEDRHRAALALTMSVADNAALGFHHGAPLERRKVLSQRRIGEHAARIVADCDVRISTTRAQIRQLSGGNQQKLVVGRELARSPRVMIAAQPTRGLDLSAIAFVHRRLRELADRGAAVLLVSLDVNEIIDLADRLIVMYEGDVAGECRCDEVDLDLVSGWMTGAV